MEKLTLTGGRFIPPHGGEMAQRVERMEEYLAKLTQDMELWAKALNGIAAESAVVSLSGEEEDA